MSDDSIMRKRLDVQKMYLDPNGNNLFEVALRGAIAKERKYLECDSTDIDGNNPRKSSLSYGQECQSGNVSVEYHNRWCFYFHDSRKGQIFITDFPRWKMETKKDFINMKLNINESYYHAIIDAMIKCNCFA